MIFNSSDTARYDQILKQITYGEKKVKKKREILKIEEEDMEEREKRKYLVEVQGRHTSPLLKSKAVRLTRL